MVRGTSNKSISEGDSSLIFKFYHDIMGRLGDYVSFGIINTDIRRLFTVCRYQYELKLPLSK